MTLANPDTIPSTPFGTKHLSAHLDLRDNVADTLGLPPLTQPRGSVEHGLCSFHASVLASCAAKTGHEAPDAAEQRAADFARQCPRCGRTKP